MVMLLVSMTGRAMTPPRSGFVQQVKAHGRKKQRRCLRRYVTLALSFQSKFL
jgi:hypothetical protein